MKVHRSSFYRWLKKTKFREDYDALLQERIDQAEASLFKNIQAGDSTSIIFFLKTQGKLRGYVEGERVRTGETPAKKAVEILDSLLAGTIDAITAALQFSREGLPLPDALRVLLSKTEPPEPEKELPPDMSDAELQAGYERKMMEIDRQKEVWLPERRKETAELKKELKDADSFKPDAEPKRGNA